MDNEDEKIIKLFKIISKEKLNIKDNSFSRKATEEEYFRAYLYFIIRQNNNRTFVYTNTFLNKYFNKYYFIKNNFIDIATFLYNGIYIYFFYVNYKKNI